MKKIVLVFLLIAFVHDNLDGQNRVNGNNFIELTSFFSSKDSSICLRIKNISDSIIVLNSKDAEYIRIDSGYVCDLSLICSGVSLLQPSEGTFMYFKHLMPKSTYTVTIFCNQENGFSYDQFKLLLQIEFIVIKQGFVFIDNILNRHFKEMIIKNHFTLYYIQKELTLDKSKQFLSIPLR